MNPFTKLSKAAAFAQRRGYKGFLVLFISKAWRAVGRRYFWRKGFMSTAIIKTISYSLDIKQHITHKDKPPVKFNPYSESQTEAFIRSLPSNYSSIVTTCDQLTNGKLQLAATGKIDIATADAWTTDLLTSRAYPKILAAEYHEEFIPESGDPRLLWELNRLQFLVTLAQGYILTKNEDYLRAAINIINSWVNDNKFCYGVNWADTQEVGIRMTSIIITQMLFKSAGASIDSETPIQQIITEHSNYVLFNLSMGRATHNHLMTELASLLIYSLTFSAEDPYQNLKKVFSCWMLKNEIKKQLDADGISREQSTNYTFFVYDAIILANYYYYTSHGNSIIDSLTLRRMINVIQAFSVGATDFVKIGDADCGRHSRLSWVSDLSRNGFIDIIETIFLNTSASSPRNSEELFWLSPTTFLETIDTKTDRALAINPTLYKSSGLLAFKANNRQLFLRLGPTNNIDPDVRFGHAHSDYLSFSIYVDNEPIFVDPGTYTYLGPGSKRSDLRSAMNHNTVMLDEMEFLDVIQRTFGIPELFEVSIADLTESDSFYSVSASFEYEQKKFIGRKYIFDKMLDYVVILNQCRSDTSSAMRESFAISQKVKPLDAENYSLLLPNNGTATLSLINNTSNQSVTTEKEMYYAPRYGIIKNGTLLKRMTTLSQSSAETFTIIRFTDNAIDPNSILSAIQDSAANEFI